MAGKVFISCGQSTDDERQFATDLGRWFEEKGYSPYVAIEAQSIQDVNSGIISELKNSDFYVFVDFKREKIAKKGKYRGSLFTNQELAIAYVLRFENAVFFRESGIELEGLAKYALSNATEFAKRDELLEKVKQKVEERKWKPTYTRHLMAERLVWSREIPMHTDHVSNVYKHCKILQVRIQNNRTDRASFDTAARLESIMELKGDLWNTRVSPDKTLLKATDMPGFNHVIWPNSLPKPTDGSGFEHVKWPDNYCAFDLLLIQRGDPKNLYLVSGLDSNPKSPVISVEGTYKLHYSVVAQGFPLLHFLVRITHDGSFDGIDAHLEDKGAAGL